jgi:putative spermidine/putrescine transport system ATP-binding protein
MGYRNMLEFSIESALNGQAVLTGAGVRLTGVVRDELVGGRAIAAIRPEDLLVGTVGENQLNVTVEVVEYHGREQSVQGRLADGEAVFFRSDKRLAPGDQVTLGVPTERVVLFSTDSVGAPTELVT